MSDVYGGTGLEDHYPYTTYRDSSDICEVCGKRGGEHYTDGKGISWCESPRNPQRRPYRYFTYGDALRDIGL